MQQNLKTFLKFICPNLFGIKAHGCSENYDIQQSQITSGRLYLNLFYIYHYCMVYMPLRLAVF